MKRYGRLVWLQLRVSVATAMAYRANFLAQGAMALVFIILTIVPLLVAFGGQAKVAPGWDEAGAFVVMSYFMTVRAILEGVTSPSIVDLVERIRSGAFDYVLLKPADAQFMVSTSRYEPWKVFDLLGGIGVGVYAFWLRGAPPAPADLALGILLLFAGVLAMYAMWIVCAAASFWVVRLDNLVYLLGAIFDVARWPIQVFQGAWRIIFTFVIPVAVMTTFPAMALLGRLDLPHVLATLGGAALMLVVARAVWTFAIRNYTSASS
ncbi:MAG TPA: ABC-2 family transporter protein [Kofleriaceae bacterium]|nr:ABC-2 family transporter protein [Kofleriaceae bacterium]